LRLDRDNPDPESAKRRPLQLTPWEEALARDAIRKQTKDREDAELRNAFYRAGIRAAEKYTQDPETPSEAKNEQQKWSDAEKVIKTLGGAEVASIITGFLPKSAQPQPQAPDESGLTATRPGGSRDPALEATQLGASNRRGTKKHKYTQFILGTWDGGERNRQTIYQMFVAQLPESKRRTEADEEKLFKQYWANACKHRPEMRGVNQP
jgi:hypothetical protein